MGLGKLFQNLSIKQAECQNLTAHSKGSKTLHTDNRNMKTQVPLVASTDVSISSGPMSGMKVSSKDDEIQNLKSIHNWKLQRA